MMTSSIKLDEEIFTRTASQGEICLDCAHGEHGERTNYFCGCPCHPQPDENVLTVRLDHLRARLAEASEAARALIVEAAGNVDTDQWTLLNSILGRIERTREDANSVLLKG